MSYTTIKKAFHNPHEDHEVLLKKRISNPDTIHIGLKIAGNPAFYTVCPDIYESILRVEKADKEILRISHSLPGKALEQFSLDNLIDEIVITNEIEGVNSTRREIGDVLKNLEKSDRKKRFHGLVKKYAMLESNTWEAITRPEDIRSIYDELVLPEIAVDNPDNLPDGEMFRSDFVSVYDPSQREIHRGIMPESKIIEYLEKALTLLNSEGSPADLAKAAAFHFLFGYIHPFYDGNGRMNRFISSQYMARRYEPVMGFGLSCTIKKHLNEYYGAFRECEDPLNRGDITPFVISFCDILAEGAERIHESLSQKKRLFGHYSQVLYEAINQSNCLSKRADHIANVLLQAALFSAEGISTKELVSVTELSRVSIHRKIQEISEVLPIKRTMVGKEALFMIDLESLNRRLGT